MAKKRSPLSPEALEFFWQQGAKGGKLGGAKAWENMTAEERPVRAKKLLRPVKLNAKLTENRVAKTALT